MPSTYTPEEFSLCGVLLAAKNHLLFVQCMSVNSSEYSNSFAYRSHYPIVFSDTPPLYSFHQSFFQQPIVTVISKTLKVCRSRNGCDIQTTPSTSYFFLSLLSRQTIRDQFFFSFYSKKHQRSKRNRRVSDIHLAARTERGC